MRITLESDYALRILASMAQYDGVTDAKTISSDTSVTLRFTLKILNKLVQGGIVGQDGYLNVLYPQVVQNGKGVGSHSSAVAEEIYRRASPPRSPYQVVQSGHKQRLATRHRDLRHLGL